jgi:hypothetical protein
MNFELANKLTELLEVKKLDEAIEVAEDELNKIPKTDFHKIIGKNLKHLTAVLKKYIADFDRATTNELRKKQGFFKSIFGSNTAYSLWRVNGCQQGFRSVASFGFGGQESASKPPQAICKPLIPINELMSFRHDRLEKYYFDQSFDWVIYMSHENTIAFGGMTIINQLKNAWSDWEKNINQWEE